MRSLFTRTAQHKKGHRLTPVAFAIFAAAAFVVLSTAMGKAAYRAPLSPNDNIITGIITGTLPPAPALPGDNFFMRHAEQGNEGIELAARLTQTGGFIQRPINWQVFQRDADLGTIGKSVFKGKTAIVDTALPPGNYHIEVKYGHASANHDITILPRTRIGLTFVLNVGGLRALSRVAGMDASHYSDAKHTIVALFDNKPEKLITDSVAQGQTVRLAAGQYRIESRFDKGNTLAIVNVTIKPGILTSLNIDHQAALAKLSLQAGNVLSAKDLPAKVKTINWQVYSHKGNWQTTGKIQNLAQNPGHNPAQSPAMILAPGRYTFSANIGNTKFSRTVSLPEGKATTIVLGK